MHNELLTTKAVAALLSVHPKHVYRLLRQGLPAVRVGDEWRFDRFEVLSWAAQRAGRARAPVERASGAPLPVSPPPLLAANGDCAIELLLELLPKAGGPLLGLVTSDHAGAGALLAAGCVLVAGQHGEAAPPRGKWARIHLMTREVGLASVRRFRRVLLGALPGARLASRPQTAGIRQRLDVALEQAGTDPALAYRGAVELASHRDVVLAITSGEAEIGLTTQAWASRAGLEFQALGAESYELLVPPERLGEPAVVALCELLQGKLFRQQLKTRFGYGIARTGELRVGG